MLSEFWSFSSYTAAGFAAVAMPGLAMEPEYFWSRRDQLRSAVNARFLTGVQHGVDTDDREVEVRIAGRTRERDCSEVAADQALAGSAVLQLGIATVDGARPVRAPVVGIATTQAPGLDGVDAGTGTEDAVGNTGETGALIRACRYR